MARITGNRKIEEASYKPVISSEKKSDEVSPFAYNYGPSFRQIDMLNGVCLHNQGYDGAGMVIAVLDAGFWHVDSLPIFDSLRANNQILGTWDFVDNDTNVYDSHTHGMMVLSTMGGNVPGQIVGTAPKAKYWLLRTEEGATEYVIEEDNWVSGAEFADSAGADVFNTSLGYTEFDSVIINSVTVVNPDNHTYADMDGNSTRISIATDIAASKGILPVNSAGNSGGSPWNFIGAPADADSVLAVGAVDSAGNYAWFSSNGPTFDGRVKPNVAAHGQDAYVANPGGGIMKGSGTSFSGPITAGMVASLWQAHPAATNMQIFNAIQQTASRFSNPDTLTGYGIPDFCAASLALGTTDPDFFDLAVKVYPNPFLDEVTVSSLQLAACELKLYDVFGKILLQKSKIKEIETIKLQNLPAGIYLLNLKTETGSYSTKLVKR